MIIMKNFKSYSPENIPKGLELADFTRSEDGRDWYSSQPLFSSKTLKIIFDNETKKVLTVHKDVSCLFPADGASIAEIHEVNLQEKIPYIYCEEKSTILPDIEKINITEQKNRLLAIVKDINELRDEMLTGLADERDKRRFKALVKYRKSLLNIKITSTTVEWPIKPE